jgi:hypothetical protein
MAPTVHINGTSVVDLIRQATRVTRALNAALRAMEEVAPNGRDYYPQGPLALNQALAEHKARVALVERLRQEYDELAMALLDGASAGGPI